MSSPYEDDRAHLVPLLEAFQASGNHPISHWFLPREGGGWDVHMRQELDPVLVGRHLATDELRGAMSFANDTLICAHCSTQVLGLHAPDSEL